MKTLLLKNIFGHLGGFWLPFGDTSLVECSVLKIVRRAVWSSGCWERKRSLMKMRVNWNQLVIFNSIPGFLIMSAWSGKNVTPSVELRGYEIASLDSL